MFALIRIVPARLRYLTLLWLAFTPALASQPNLVIFYVDDLGYGDLGSYGHQIVTTPNIDRLAAEGVKFTQYYAPAPLCSPSRAGLLTGRTPYRTGIRSWIPDGQNIHLGANEITLAHLLKQKGYATAVMGKLHLNGGADMQDHPQAIDLGFDYSFVIPGGWVKNKTLETAPADGSRRHGKLYPDNYWRNGIPVPETNKFSAELVADEVLHWLEQHVVHHKEDTAPFFLYVPFSEVHTPIASPAKYLDMYSQYITAEGKSQPDLYHWDWGDRPYRGQGEYYANISFLDAQIGRIIQKLESMQQLDSTIIFFASDNGPVTREARKPWELNMAGETGGLRGRKDNLLEGGIRVPGILRYGDTIPAGVTVKRAVTGLDILPTLATLMNFDVPKDREIDGQSIVPMLSGEMMLRHKPLIWSIDMPGQDDPVNEWAIRVGAWKMILDRERNPKFLFDIERDPYEMFNRLGHPEQKTVQTDLLKAFQAYLHSIDNDAIKSLREET
jgi:arylsulfatase A-like enzyme